MRVLLLGLIDDAHTALAQEPDDPVAADLLGRGGHTGLGLLDLSAHGVHE